MNKPSWTPGPWTADVRSGTVLAPIEPHRPDGFLGRFVKVDSDFCGLDSAVAVARLIASAPETHAAARELLAAIWDGTPERGSTPENVFNAAMALKASLDKAEGLS